MKLIFTIPLLVLLLTACGESKYTLYRSSAVSNGGENWRVHVATFDAKVDDAYNMGNCQIAQELFQKQPGVTIKYWCEKGEFKK